MSQETNWQCSRNAQSSCARSSRRSHRSWTQSHLWPSSDPHRRSMSSRPSPMASVPVTSSEISSPTAPKFTTRLPSISPAVPSSPSRSVSFPCLYGPNSPSSCLHVMSTSSDGAPVAVLRSIIVDAADLSRTDRDCASYHRSFRNSLSAIS